MPQNILYYYFNICVPYQKSCTRLLSEMFCQQASCFSFDLGITIDDHDNYCCNYYYYDEAGGPSSRRQSHINSYFLSCWQRSSSLLLMKSHAVLKFDRLLFWKLYQSKTLLLPICVSETRQYTKLGIISRTGWAHMQGCKISWRDI